VAASMGLSMSYILLVPVYLAWVVKFLGILYLTYHLLSTVFFSLVNRDRNNVNVIFARSAERPITCGLKYTGLFINNKRIEGVRFLLADIENYMNAVERVLEYTHLGKRLRKKTCSMNYQLINISPQTLNIISSFENFKK
jgi:hypothetical protein